MTGFSLASLAIFYLTKQKERSLTYETHNGKLEKILK